MPSDVRVGCARTLVNAAATSDQALVSQNRDRPTHRHPAYLMESADPALRRQCSALRVAASGDLFTQQVGELYVYRDR